MRLELKGENDLYKKYAGACLTKKEYNFLVSENVIPDGLDCVVSGDISNQSEWMVKKIASLGEYVYFESVAEYSSDQHSWDQREAMYFFDNFIVINIVPEREAGFTLSYNRYNSPGIKPVAIPIFRINDIKTYEKKELYKTKYMIEITFINGEVFKSCLFMLGGGLNSECKAEDGYFDFLVNSKLLSLSKTADCANHNMKVIEDKVLELKKRVTDPNNNYRILMNAYGSDSKFEKVTIYMAEKPLIRYLKKRKNDIIDPSIRNVISTFDESEYEETLKKQNEYLTKLDKKIKASGLLRCIIFSLKYHKADLNLEKYKAEYEKKMSEKCRSIYDELINSSRDIAELETFGQIEAIEEKMETLYNEEVLKSNICFPEKYIQIYEEEKKMLKELAKTSELLANFAASNISTKSKTANWAIVGGTVSGLLGPTAGMIAAGTTYVENKKEEEAIANIRATSQRQIDSNMSLYSRSTARQSTIEKEIQQLNSKKVYWSENVDLLSFFDVEIRDYESDYEQITDDYANLTLRIVKKQDPFINGKMVIIDGSFILHLMTKNNRKIGHAIVNAPGFGETYIEEAGFVSSKREVTWVDTVVKLERKSKTTDFKIKIEPLKLWAVEV